MKLNRDNIPELLANIGCLPTFASVLFLGFCLLNATKTYQKIKEGDVVLLSLIFLAFFIIILYVLVSRLNTFKDDYEHSLAQIKKKYEDSQINLKNEFKDKETALCTLMDEKEQNILYREKIVKDFVNSIDKEKYCAELISDFKTVLFEKAGNWLENKFYGAPTAAETVRLLRAKTREYITELKMYKYKEEERLSKTQKQIEQANEMVQLMKSKVIKIENILHNRTPFQEVAALYADALSIAYGDIAKDLKAKVRPAFTRAEVVERELRKKIRETALEAKQLKYRVDFLLNIYPEIENYLYDDDSLLSIAQFNSIEDLNDNRDRARDYLSDDEYNELSEIERYQLSLERYKSRHKPNAWIAGAEYEMYCCHLLKSQGFTVVENGINMRKADMGRDIIAHKEGNTYIIQCKRYSLYKKNGEDKFVHENVICQLFGTTIEYQIANPNNKLFSDLNKVVPVLYTTGRLSDTAKKFANRLGVKVVQCEMKDYPMIKCNINDGEKIYHLPFDQQYWHTKIDKSGEFFAWTVEEAVRKGFRRAMRWRG